MNENLVSSKWLKENLENENLIILDASMENKVSGAIADHKNKSIPESRYFNIKEKFSDKKSQFPNTLVSEEHFQTECRKLGINQSSHIVVYDSLGIYSSPRVWWMFKTMGHNKVSVLNGGLPQWIDMAYPIVEKEIKNYASGDFIARFNADNVKYYEDILKNSAAPEAILIDARSEGRFNGTAEEPRKYLKSGHIPNSINIPYQNVLQDGCYKSKAELKKVFESTPINNNLIFSCGSGLTACIVLLASELIQDKKTSVFDGSWTEWAERQNLKVE
jgi:thiosulfate/3-mercaptopyruvate sulfurtransferase